jgi:hypothetical protein
VILHDDERHHDSGTVVDYGLGLLPQHAALLPASSITREAAQARRSRSVTRKGERASAGTKGRAR